MPLGESKSYSLTRVSEALNLVGESVEFSIDAVQRTTSLEIIAAADFNWTEPCV